MTQLAESKVNPLRRGVGATHDVVLPLLEQCDVRALGRDPVQHREQAERTRPSLLVDDRDHAAFARQPVAHPDIAEKAHPAPAGDQARQLRLGQRKAEPADAVGAQPGLRRADREERDMPAARQRVALADRLRVSVDPARSSKTCIL